MLAAHIDFETRSRTDLRKSGVYRYAEDLTTRPWGFSWRIGMGPVFRWLPGMPDPVELLQHIALGGKVVAHNAAFERTVWNMIVVARMCTHWPMIRIEQQDCTMARAAAIAHPQELGKLCEALGTENSKDREGAALMMKMAKPRKFNPDGSITWWDEPHNIERLMQYCDQDVRTECDVDERVPPLTDSERQVWILDQTINERGIHIDVHAAKLCVNLVELAKKKADSVMRRITRGDVPKCSNDNKLIAWINAQGIECSTVKKGVQDDLIFMANIHNNDAVVDAISLRRASKKTSTAKYKAMMECFCADHRVRGLLAYHGAAPGRWAGRLLQPQNFPRVDYDDEGHWIEWMHQLFVSGMPVTEIYDMVAAVYGDAAVLNMLSRLLRSMVMAAPGNKLVGGDLANIEGRLNAWFANETWKLEAFRAYDNGTGPDLYNLAYAKSFGIDVADVSKAQRQIGKVEELALGYQGGVGAFINMGDNYGLDPYKLSKPIYDATDPAIWDAKEALYEKARDKHGLQAREWTALKVIVDLWRKSNPNIVQSWWDYQDAAIAAVSTPGQVVSCVGGKVSYYSDQRNLWCVLPAGRMLCYSSPWIEQEVQVLVNQYGEEYERTRKKVMFYGMNSETNQWTRNSLYGGHQCENIVQGTARDVMVNCMFEAERKNYPIILTVHDELVAEVPESRNELNDKDFKTIMTALPHWAAGLPLAAKTWQDKRYVK
jgi:DNA polymerase